MFASNFFVSQSTGEAEKKRSALHLAAMAEYFSLPIQHMDYVLNNQVEKKAMVLVSLFSFV